MRAETSNVSQNVQAPAKKVGSSSQNVQLRAKTPSASQNVQAPVILLVAIFFLASDEITSLYTQPYVARRLVSARLVVTDTLLAHFRSSEKNDLQTDGPTDGRTDTPSYRVAPVTKKK